MVSSVKTFSDRPVTAQSFAALKAAVTAKAPDTSLSSDDIAFGKRLVEMVRPLFTGPLATLLSEQGASLKARRSQLEVIDKPMIAARGVRIELTSDVSVGRSRQSAHIDRDLAVMYLVSTSGGRETWYAPEPILDAAGDKIPSAVLWGGKSLSQT